MGKISIIITTKNEAAVLERLLISIQNQSYTDWEIILVDNKSTDTTKKIAARYTDNVYDFGPERSAQRNFGVEKADGDYVIILDADMELSATVLEECIKKIQKNNQIGGIVIPEKSVVSNFWERIKAFEREFYNDSGDEYTEAARFFRRSVFKEHSGYDESITGPEDWDLPERIKKSGYRIERVTAKINHYERIPSLMSLARKKYYYALKTHRYLKKHNISQVSSKTVYFLRPVFYKNWKKLVGNLQLSIPMFVMLSVELFAGGVGYIVGLVRYR